MNTEKLHERVRNINNCFDTFATVIHDSITNPELAAKLESDLLTVTYRIYKHTVEEYRNPYTSPALINESCDESPERDSNE